MRGHAGQTQRPARIARILQALARRLAARQPVGAFATTSLPSSSLLFPPSRAAVRRFVFGAK